MSAPPSSQRHLKEFHSHVGASDPPRKARLHLISNCSRNRRQKSAGDSVLTTPASARIHVKVAAGEDDR
jgi:hypothetical protein